MTDETPDGISAGQRYAGIVPPELYNAYAQVDLDFEDRWEGVKDITPEIVEQSLISMEGASAKGKPPESYKTWPERVLQSIWSGLTLSGDVASGKVNPASNEAIERAFELAGVITFGTMPIPKTSTAIGRVPPRATESVTGEVIPPTAASTAPAGSLERVGLQTFDRELGRTGPGRFGRVPEEMSRGRGGPSWQANREGSRATTNQTVRPYNVPTGWDRRDFTDTFRENVGRVPTRTELREARELLRTTGEGLYSVEGRMIERARASAEAPRGWSQVEGGARLSPITKEEFVEGAKVKFTSGSSVLEKMYLDAGTSQFSGNTTVARLKYIPAEGKPANISVHYNDVTKDIYVDGIYSSTHNAWTQGTKETRTLLRLIHQAFPEAETITGFRASGARQETRKGAAKASMKLPKRKVESE